MEEKMRKCLGKMFVGAALVAISAAPALAADQLIPGKIMIVKPATLAKVLAKGTFTLPTGADQPTTAGGSLLIRDLGNPMNVNTYSLPSSGWKGLGNPAGTKGYKYKGAGSVSDPCKVVLIKTKIVKAVCKGAGVTLTAPVSIPPAEVAVNLSSGAGTSYCAEFGGTEIKNAANIVKRKDAPAPSACSSPSGAFIETASLF
jgi:putative hemolysin